MTPPKVIHSTVTGFGFTAENLRHALSTARRVDVEDLDESVIVEKGLFEALITFWEQHDQRA